MFSKIVIELSYSRVSVKVRESNRQSMLSRHVLNGTTEEGPSDRKEL